MKLPSTLLSELLGRPYPQLCYELSARIKSASSTMTVLETEDSDFDVFEFARSGGCSLELNPSMHAHDEKIWVDDRIKSRPVNGVYDIKWRDENLVLVYITYDEYSSFRCFLLSSNAVVGERFFATVCKCNTDVNDSILLLENGQFERNDELRDAIRNTTLSQLIMTDERRCELRTHIISFFQNEKLYEDHGLPWKRGAILYGPPGNGKTQTVKALINEAKRPALIVKSFESEKKTASRSIIATFERAREMAPCFLVLEDIDSLISEHTTSVFLNEMDGFARNHGILTLATTNHLDKIDPALSKRPSRFDKKILFSGPRKEERRKYIETFQAKWPKAAQLGPEELDTLVSKTKGASMAMLKEVMISGLQSGTFDSSEKLESTTPPTSQLETMLSTMTGWGLSSE